MQMLKMRYAAASTNATHSVASNPHLAPAHSALNPFKLDAAVVVPVAAH